MPTAELPSGGIGITILISGVKCVVFNDHVRMEFPSRRDPAKVYTVEYSPSIENCTCAGFSYSGHCRHINKAKELFKG